MKCLGECSKVDIKEVQRLAQKKWFQNNPDYWKGYRRRNSETWDKCLC